MNFHANIGIYLFNSPKIMLAMPIKDCDMGYE